MTHPPLQALVFDLDNTLFDHAAAMRRYLHSLGLSEAATDPLLEFDAAGTADRLDLCAAIAEQSDRFSSAEQAWDHLRTGFPTFVDMGSGVRTVLREIAGRYRIGLLTDGGSATQRAKLERLELDLLFADRVVISGELGVAKPDPRAFRAILDLIGARPTETAYVGDDPVRDVAGAASVGMRTCWVSRGRQWPAGALTPDWTIDTVDELRSATDIAPATVLSDTPA